MSFLTELTSNTASVEIILPVLASLSGKLHLAPLFLMIPATLSASCAFMLPVATPPNAIVFSSGRVRVLDMAKIGFVINLLSVLVVTAVLLLSLEFFDMKLFH
jgi:sodium-dependent dicarboxylate transporter 2/3/5